MSYGSTISVKAAKAPAAPVHRAAVINTPDTQAMHLFRGKKEPVFAANMLYIALLTAVRKKVDLARCLV